MMNNTLLFWPYLMPPFNKNNQSHTDHLDEQDKDKDECVDSYEEPHYTLELYQL